MTKFYHFLIGCLILLLCGAPLRGLHAQADEGTPPKLLSAITITYPQEAKDRRIEGKVWLALLIDTTGSVEAIKVERSDNPLLNQAAIDAMRGARFAPSTYQGVPEKVWFQQALTFKLSYGDTATVVKQLLKDSPPQPLVPLAQLFLYPPDAKAAGIEGTVSLQALIDTNGKVEKTEILSSSLPGFEAAALKAMSDAEFLPAIENGVKVRAWFQQSLNFSLPSSDITDVVGIDTNITAAPELLDEMPAVLSRTVRKAGHTTVRVLVAENGVVKNVLALDKNADAITLSAVLEAAYKLPFAPGLWKGRVTQLWTDVTFEILPLK